MESKIMKKFNKLKKFFSDNAEKIFTNTLFVGIILLLAYALVASQKQHSPTNKLKATIELQHNELQYWKYKDSLYVSIKDYINKIAPTSSVDALYLINTCDESDIDIRFVMAQAQLESHFGTRGMAAKTNQMFNVGAYDNASYDKIHKDYKYENVNLSIKPYLRLLRTKYLCYEKTTADLLNKYEDHNHRRYASDPSYETKLKSIYNRINTDSLNRLLNNYYKYKNLCKK